MRELIEREWTVIPYTVKDSTPKDYLVSQRLFYPYHYKDKAIDHLSPHNIKAKPTSYRLLGILKETYLRFYPNQFML